jgi:hypothetical protein
MNGNTYHSDIQFQNELAAKMARTPIRPAGYQFGNGTLPLDWLTRHSVLPNAMFAGKVGPAGGYADPLNQSMYYQGRESTSWMGPAVVAGLIIFVLYSRA